MTQNDNPIIEGVDLMGLRTFPPTDDHPGRIMWFDTPENFFEMFAELGCTQEQMEDAVEKGRVIFYGKDET